MHPYLPFLIIVAAVLVAVIAVELCRHQISRRDLRTPFTPTIERAPGQSFLKRLDDLNQEIAIQAAALLAVPIAIYALYVSQLYFGGRAVNQTEALAVGALAVLFLGFTLFRLLAFFRQRRRIRLGCEGKMIVGQALNRLMLKGFRVYHDFPADGFDIDHIVVGEKGVFAVETEARFKRTRGHSRQEATVEYDGRALHFPQGTDIDMIAQAKRQSQWLARWLSQAVGEELSVRAVLALPGWFVKRTTSQGLPVVNPDQFDSLFEHIPARFLSPDLVTRITHRLDQKWRDSVPST